MHRQALAPTVLLETPELHVHTEAIHFKINAIAFDSHVSW